MSLTFFVCLLQRMHRTSWSADGLVLIWKSSFRKNLFRQSFQTQPLWSAEHENVICLFPNTLQPWLQAPPRNQASTAQMFSLSWLLGILPLSSYLPSLDNQGLKCSQKAAHCPAGYLCNVAMPKEHVNKYLFFLKKIISSCWISWYLSVLSLLEEKLIPLTFGGFCQQGNLLKVSEQKMHKH